MTTSTKARGARNVSPARMTTPKLALATSPAAVDRIAKAGLSRGKTFLSRILRVKGRRSIENTLDPYNEILRAAYEVVQQGELVFNVHPNAKVRDAGNRAYQAGMSFLTELTLNRDLYEAFEKLDVRSRDAETRFAVFKIHRDFKRAGVDKDEATRGRIKALNEEITAIGSEFDRNINEDVRSIELDSPKLLEGLPADYIAARPAKEGKITITTNYPDALPVFQYARNAEVRRRMQWEFLNRGYPKNMAVLDRLLVKRNELARLLGYGNYAEYVTEDKMIGSAKAAADFVGKIEKASGPRTDKDYKVLVERKRKESPFAEALDSWDPSYLIERVRAEQYSFSSQEVRPFFQFEKVRDGIFAITGKLFGVRYARVTSPTWHESVEAYDVFDDGSRLGRFYLDLHPRPGKFNHAAAFPLIVGLRGTQLPQAALVCNFPDPRTTKGPALMEHNDVVTFFHEFGHLLHDIFSGGSKWLKTSMGDIEWDFVEAPSQMLEEWARRPEGLQGFATHHETGEPIPKELVERMERAQAFARGLLVRRQIFFAALSLAYYNRDPKDIDTTALAKELNAAYYPVPWYEGTHFQCNFGHLNGYSAVYYTYMWSLVIAKDLFTPFQKKGVILDPVQAGKYRRLILEPGSAKPAAAMVREYLGRPPRFDAFRRWLDQGAS
ncbi:MAG: Zn-dependent oligopeptidase [Methanobacteriota archaeon]|nr:MAG: Zn-dependent oligopeptidase [Euryarchaeota archaeon]